MKTIVVASQNPVKIRAVREGFEMMKIDDSFEMIGLNVSSEVSDQPATDAETYQGAINRAYNAQKVEPKADFWVGVEGGVEHKGNDMYAFAWVIVLSKERKGESRTASFQLPHKVVELIQQGVELGKADDMVFGKINSKHHLGSVGILTHGEIDRTSLYSPAVCFALIPFVNQSLY
jgi:inosine/xanthosine triphosphatase